MAVSCYGTDRLNNTQIKLSHGDIYNKEESCKETQRLEGVRPDKRFDASPAGIEPNEQHHDCDSDGERYAPYIRNELLQQHADDIESDDGTRKFRQQEERGSRLVRPRAETLAQVTVDGSQVVPIIQRQQQECHHDVAHDET